MQSAFCCMEYVSLPSLNESEVICLVLEEWSSSSTHTHTHNDWSCVGRVSCSSELRKMYMHQEVSLDVQAVWMALFSLTYEQCLLCKTGWVSNENLERNGF